MKTMHGPGSAVAAIIALAAMSGCRNDMYDQPKYKPLAKGSNLIGPTSALQLPDGVVAREEPAALTTFDTGMKDGKLAEDLPLPLSKELLVRGKDRYGIYCTPCHGTAGDGQGMIVKRGFSPPPSFHTDELRNAPLGHFFDVITNGHGAMYSYAARVEKHDRWAIAAFIRALQLSQDAPSKDLPAVDQAKLAEVN